MTLKDIAIVSSGVTFRSRIEASKGGVRVIQMKDLSDDNFVCLEQTVQVNYPDLRPHQWAKRGDILFRSRGQTHTAALLREEAANTIVSAPLFRVRPDTRQVLPEFLFWWINQRTSQAYLASRVEGTILAMVSKQSLEGLPVKLPSMVQQRQIADFFRLAMREQQILDAIKHRKAIVTQGILMQMVLRYDGAASNNTSSVDAGGDHRQI